MTVSWETRARDVGDTLVSLGKQAVMWLIKGTWMDVPEVIILLEEALVTEGRERRGTEVMGWHSEVGSVVGSVVEGF